MSRTVARWLLFTFLGSALLLGRSAWQPAVAAEGPDSGIVAFDLGAEETSVLDHKAQIAWRLNGNNIVHPSVTSAWYMSYIGEPGTLGGRVVFDLDAGTVTGKITEQWKCATDCAGWSYRNAALEATITNGLVSPDGDGWAVSGSVKISYEADGGKKETPSVCGDEDCYICADQFCTFKRTLTGSASLTGNLSGTTLTLLFADGLTEDPAKTDVSSLKGEYFLSRLSATVRAPVTSEPEVVDEPDDEAGQTTDSAEQAGGSDTGADDPGSTDSEAAGVDDAQDAADGSDDKEETAAEDAADDSDAVGGSTTTSDDDLAKKAAVAGTMAAVIAGAATLAGRRSEALLARIKAGELAVEDLTAAQQQEILDAESVKGYFAGQLPPADLSPAQLKKVEDALLVAGVLQGQANWEDLDPNQQKQAEAELWNDPDFVAAVSKQLAEEIEAPAVPPTITFGPVEYDPDKNAAKLGPLVYDLDKKVAKLGPVEYDLDKKVAKVGELEYDLDEKVARGQFGDVSVGYDVGNKDVGVKVGGFIGSYSLDSKDWIIGLGEQLTMTSTGQFTVVADGAVLDFDNSTNQFTLYAPGLDAQAGGGGWSLGMTIDLDANNQLTVMAGSDSARSATLNSQIAHNARLQASYERYLQTNATGTSVTHASTVKLTVGRVTAIKTSEMDSPLLTYRVDL